MKHSLYIHWWVIGFLVALLNAAGQVVQAQSPAVNITTHQPGNALPAGVTLEWHNGLPISASNLITGVQTTSATPGLYYAVYNYGGSPVCYSQPSYLRVLTNTCPATYVDLTAAVDPATIPASATVTFHSSATASAATQLSSSTVTASSSETAYYAAFRTYDANTNTYCYSETTPIVVVLTSCIVLPTIAISTPNNVTVASTNPPISGTSSPGASVTVTGGSGSTGGPCITTANGSGNWSCSSITFPSGPTSVTATDGITTAVSQFTTTSPTVAIVSPANSTTTALNPTVSGTATPGSTVVLTSSTSGTLCSTTAAAGGTWSCPVTLTAGPQTLSALATNSNGVSSPATTQITAINTTPPLTASNPPALTASPGSTNTGSAANEMLPSGGSTPYVYSNDTGNPSCSAVAGATQLPTANLTVASGTGSYSYTAPSTPGVYYFCLKVCDSSTPTPSCVTKTYTLTVTTPAAVGTLDCSTAQITGLVAGTAGNGVLKLSINVTVAGAFPVTVSGSGMSASPSPYTINTASTGLQTFYVPLTYSGAAFGPTTITVTGAGVCSPDMSLVTPKTVSTSVLNLGPACTPVTAATLVK